MKSLINEMKQRFHEIESSYCDACDRPKDKCICDEETVEEQNTTAAVAGFNTPAAFSKKTNRKTAEQLGYKQVESDQVQEAMDRKYEAIIESYSMYATGDAKVTPEGKIKNTIKEVARQLQEIEKTVNYAARLKTESNIARNGYGPAVDKALSRISERLIKISERVRALGE
jgi:phage terminase small subunit